jgi:hypothetical protein
MIILEDEDIALWRWYEWEEDMGREVWKSLAGSGVEDTSLARENCL